MAVLQYRTTRPAPLNGTGMRVDVELARAGVDSCAISVPWVQD